MIYPVDVHRNVINTRKLVGRDRTAVILQLFLFANFGLFFLLRFIFGQILMMDAAFAWIAQIVICVFCGVFIFRVFIFKEDEKIKEYESSESDSFSKFLNIRKDSEYSRVVGNKKINIYEYINGCAACTFCFKFGSNDNIKANNTARVFNTLCNLVHSYQYELKIAVLPEKFENSSEFMGYIECVNQVKDKRLGMALKEIANMSLSVSERYSNVDCLYVTVKTNAAYKRGELENLILAFWKVLEETNTCFRSVNLLNMNELLEFYRDFSTVEAIDLSMTKALDLIDMLDSEYARVVNIYSFTTSEGKSLHNDKALAAPFYLNERSIVDD
mgnify:CR=1 FL=1